jgi:Domain of Unknown Function (DUF1259)
MFRHLLLVLAIFATLSSLAQQSSSAAWKPIESALGRPCAPQPGEVCRASFPRSDLHVTVGGVPIKAGLALGGWAAFKRMGSNAVVMGDLVLTEAEVPAVMDALQQGGIQQTGVHNHLLNESPRVMYMHIMGKGDATKLAQALHDAVAKTAIPAPAGAPASVDQKIDLDTNAVDQALGRKGRNNNGIYQFSVARGERITDQGMEVPPSMGTATGINFQPTGNGKAAITGDFVLLASEVNPVIQALRQNGIEVTAVHSHMLTEQPRLFFMHFWANDDAVKLARGLRAALDKTNSATPQQR